MYISWSLADYEWYNESGRRKNLTNQCSLPYVLNEICLENQRQTKAT
jgi:hypothetical protein